MPNILSSDFKKKSRAERQAINTVCQGSAADICKLAMIAMDEFIVETKSKSRLLVQLHDELIFEVVESEWEE